MAAAAATAARATAQITPRRDTRSEIRPTGHWKAMAPRVGTAMNKAIRVAGSPSAAAYRAPTPKKVPWATPVQKQVTTPVGTMLNSLRNETGSGSAKGGELVADRVMGTKASEIRAEAPMKSRMPPGSPPTSSNWPTERPPMVTTMYMLRIRPRLEGVDMSLSQDSTVTNTPAMHRPKTNRSTAHDRGWINTRCRMAAVEESEARAANTRTWPTAASWVSAVLVPSRKPR